MYYCALFTGGGIKRKTKTVLSLMSSQSSKISTNSLQSIIDRLMYNQNGPSTCQNYLRIWRAFNQFIIQLDTRPWMWEDRVTLYMGYLVNKGIQSNTIKSYVSAIKRVLIDDGYAWKDERIMLTSLTRACKLIND